MKFKESPQRSREWLPIFCKRNHHVKHVNNVESQNTQLWGVFFAQAQNEVGYSGAANDSSALSRGREAHLVETCPRAAAIGGTGIMHRRRCKRALKAGPGSGKQASKQADTFPRDLFLGKGGWYHLVSKPIAPAGQRYQGSFLTSTGYDTTTSSKPTTLQSISASPTPLPTLE